MEGRGEGSKRSDRPGRPPETGFRRNCHRPNECTFRTGCGRLGSAHPLTENSAPAAGARGGGGGPADPGSAKSLSLSFTDPVPESLRGLKLPLHSSHVYRRYSGKS